MSKNILIFVLVLVGFFAYAFSLNNQLLWDDEQFIYKNVFVQDFAVGKIFTTNTTAGAGVVGNYYRPLTTLSFALNYALHGWHPFGFHLVNTLLHLGAGVILFLLLKRLTLGERASFWVSLLFLIHPLQTEAVVYANSRGDSFFTFLLFLSLYLFAVGFRSDRLGRWQYLDSFKKLLFYFLSGISFSLAILAKEIAVAGIGLFGLILLMFVFIESGKKKISLGLAGLIKLARRFSSEIIFILVLIGGEIFYFALRLTKLNFQNSLNFYNGENLYTQSLAVRLYTFGKIFWDYLRLLIFPYPLHMERTGQIILSPFNIFMALNLLLVISVVGVGFYELRRKRTIWIWFGSLWFLGMLAPVSGIVPINGLIYEHWLYVPMIGFFIALIKIGQILLGFLSEKFSFFKKNIARIEFDYVGVVIVTVLVLLTIRQNYLWRQPIVFYEYTLQFSESARLFNNLGMAYDAGGSYSRALNSYSQALELDDSYPQIHHNLAQTYARLNRVDEARTEYEMAITISPNFYHSYVPLIRIYLYQEKYDQALERLEQLMELYLENKELEAWRREIEKKR